MRSRTTNKLVKDTVYQTAIVIPTRDEADNIQELVERIVLATDDRTIEILFVDDSPNRKTCHAIYKTRGIFSSPERRIEVYHRKGTKRWGGLAGAVTDGLKRVTASQVIVMDGDLQHPPEYIPALLAAATSKDIAVASRYCQGGSAKGLHGLIRHLISRGSTWLAKVFFPVALRTVSDPMSGFFLVNRSAIDLGALRPSGFKILLEIIARNPHLGVSEIPFEFGERHAGTSKGTLTQGLEYLGQLGRLRLAAFGNSFRRLPRLVQFGTIGGGVFGIGMVTLFILVDILGWEPVPANGVQLALTFLLNFLLNRHITWADRTVSNLASVRFLLSRGATTILSYYLFAWLVAWQAAISIAGQTWSFEIHYLLANVLTVSLITVVNFAISDRWVFTPRKAHSLTYRRIRTLVVLGIIATLLYVVAGRDDILAVLVALVGIIMFCQASLEAWRMLYSYRNPEAVDRMKFPEAGTPQERFCLIVPARHEEAVLGTTLLELAKQTHPNVTIVTVICHDDPGTLQVAHTAAEESSRIKVLKYHRPAGTKPSKPLQLNHAFAWTRGKGFTALGVIDAEDTVHPDLLMHVDAAFQDQEIQVVQGGVQLMNHHSTWFALHNVLEYWKWFGNIMKFQVDQRFVPLGGNTVFVRYQLLKKAGGWPLSLTEDCALGVLLSTRFNAKTAAYYDPKLATQEEAPTTIKGLFFQRVRWNQGFYTEWHKGIWQELPTLRQRLVAVYILANPTFQTISSIMIPVTLVTVILLKAPVGLVLIMYAPLVPLVLQLFLNVIYLHDFGQAFEKYIRPKDYLNLFIMHFAYQIILNVAALWAMGRMLRGNNTWYKTAHAGNHRSKRTLRVEPEFATERGAL